MYYIIDTLTCIELQVLNTNKAENHIWKFVGIRPLAQIKSIHLFGRAHLRPCLASLIIVRNLQLHSKSSYWYSIHNTKQLYSYLFYYLYKLRPNAFTLSSYIIFILPLQKLTMVLQQIKPKKRGYYC